MASGRWEIVYPDEHNLVIEETIGNPDNNEKLINIYNQHLPIGLQIVQLYTIDKNNDLYIKFMEYGDNLEKGLKDKKIKNYGKEVKKIQKKAYFDALHYIKLVKPLQPMFIHLLDTIHSRSDIREFLKMFNRYSERFSKADIKGKNIFDHLLEHLDTIEPNKFQMDAMNTLLHKGVTFRFYDNPFDHKGLTTIPTQSLVAESHLHLPSGKIAKMKYDDKYKHKRLRRGKKLVLRSSSRRRSKSKSKSRSKSKSKSHSKSKSKSPPRITKRRTRRKRPIIPDSDSE